MNESSQCSPLQRDRRSVVGLCVIPISVIALAWSTAGSAAIDSYWISQLFSNADGSVQYIQLYERAGKNGQNQFAGVTITVSSGDVVRTFLRAVIGKSP